MNTKIQNKTAPQRGAVIHHQDQSITPVNFITRKTINSVPKIPILVSFLTCVKLFSIK